MFVDLYDSAGGDLVAMPHGAVAVDLDAQLLGDGQTEAADAADLEAGEGKALGELPRRVGQVHVITQPVERDFHGCGCDPEGSLHSPSDLEVMVSPKAS